MKTIEQLPLTPKQQLFCDEYLKDRNATRAALRAGYSGAMALSGKLMQVPKIKAYIKLRVKKTATKMETVRAEFLTELRRIAFANMGDYFDDDNKLKPMSKLTRDQKAAIWNVKMTESDEGNTVYLRLNNKLSAMEKLAKHLGFYDMEMQGPEVRYVYLDKDAMDEFDRLEDDSMKKSDVGSRRAEEEDDDEPEVKNERWERDKALFMEQELERLKRELPLQREKARLEAEKDGGGQKSDVGRQKSDGEKVTATSAGIVVGDNTNNGVAAVNVAGGDTDNGGAKTVKTQYSNVGLTGKIISKEERMERRRDFEYATGIKLPWRG